MKQKSRLTWNPQYSETKNLFKKLDWDVNDEPDLIWKSPALGPSGLMGLVSD